MPDGIRGMKILKAAKIAPLMLHDKGFENWCDVICDVMTPFVTSRAVVLLEMVYWFIFLSPPSLSVKTLHEKLYNPAIGAVNLPLLLS